MNDIPVAVISGGSRGLGAELVADLLKDHRVATFSRSETDLVRSYRETHGDRFGWAAVDAADFARIRSFVREVAARWGRIDVLVNNAASGDEGMLTLLREDNIHQTLRVNLESVIHLTRECVKSMLVRCSGAVVNISSIVGIRGHAGVSVYGATKAAIDGFTRGLAREVGERGVRVNAVAPGFFESDMVASLSAERRQRIARRTPLGRLAQAADVAGAVRFLLSPAAAFITGHTLVVDGGLTC